MDADMNPDISLTFHDDFSEGEVGLTKKEVRDIVDLIFRHNGTITIYGRIPDDYPKKKITHGLHTYVFGTHIININPELIKKSWENGKKTGGNTVAPTLRMATAMVLAHELQHANQCEERNISSSSFFGKKSSRYISRPAEKNARETADSSRPMLAAALNIDLGLYVQQEAVEDNEFDLIADCLSECDQITPDEIRDELRVVGLNNPMEFKRMREHLESLGVKIT